MTVLLIPINRNSLLCVVCCNLLKPARSTSQSRARLRCRIGTPIFHSPTRVSLQSVLQVFRIPFTTVTTFSMKHRAQNATRILLHNMHPLGQLQIERHSGGVVVKVVALSSCVLYNCGILALHFVLKWWCISIHLLRCTKNVCGGCRRCRGFHTEWTRCILIIFRLGLSASFFYCHVSLIAHFSGISFGLEF